MLDKEYIAAWGNANAIVTYGGTTWSAPQAIVSAGDQFKPWSAYDASGKLRIGYFDRSYDAASHKYGYTVATETSAGSLTITGTQVTTVLSDPTQGTRWFSGRVPNHATSFLGDYSGSQSFPAAVSSPTGPISATPPASQRGAEPARTPTSHARAERQK